MADLGVAAYKIASADLTNWPLLRAAAQKGKPMLLSSGGSTLDELRASIEEVRRVGNDQIILLHCILCYPAPVEEMNLRSIPTLKQEFPEVIVGLSDHSIPDPCVTVPAAAVALGAKVIEKHFTLDTGQQGIDHQLAADPPMLKTMIETIRIVEAALGSNEVRVLDCEEPARQYARRSVVAAVDMPAGTVIEPQHLIMKRPGTGVSPTQTAQMLGRKTIRAIEADQLVTWDDLDGEVPKA
jgi:N-acetylneuraminate synthase